MQHAPAVFRPAPSTWDDFVALVEDDPRELVDGELLYRRGNLPVGQDKGLVNVIEPAAFEGLRIPLAELWAPPEDEPAPPSTT